MVSRKMKLSRLPYHIGLFLWLGASGMQVLSCFLLQAYWTACIWLLQLLVGLLWMDSIKKAWNITDQAFEITNGLLKDFKVVTQKLAQSENHTAMFEVMQGWKTNQNYPAFLDSVTGPDGREGHITGIKTTIESYSYVYIITWNDKTISEFSAETIKLWENETA